MVWRYAMFASAAVLVELVFLWGCQTSWAMQGLVWHGFRWGGTVLKTLYTGNLSQFKSLMSRNFEPSDDPLGLLLYCRTAHTGQSYRALRRERDKISNEPVTACRIHVLPLQRAACSSPHSIEFCATAGSLFTGCRCLITSRLSFEKQVTVSESSIIRFVVS